MPQRFFSGSPVIPISTERSVGTNNSYVAESS
jgi:hypothetical protein